VVAACGIWCFGLQVLFLFPVALRPKAGHGFLIIVVSISHSLGAPQSV
jgi:hypothetical protein